MSTPQPPDAAAQHQAGQSALMTAFLAALARAWVVVDTRDLSASLPTFKVAVNALVTQYGQASAAAALDYYRSERAAAGLTGRPVLRLAPPPPAAQVSASVDWATRGLWGPSPAQDAAGAVVEDPVAVAERLVAASAERMVLDQGRDTLINAVQADKKARGWARVVEPGACSFCLLLATRGAVYRSQGSASFEAHNNCRCHVEPLFAGHYEPTAQVRAAQALYRESTKGKSNAAARNAFRRAVARARAEGAPHL